jgi:hypothetical protein
MSNGPIRHITGAQQNLKPIHANRRYEAMNLLDQSMGNITRDIPGATAVLHRFKLDFCCGGARTLRSAAEKKGLNTAILLAGLERLQHLEGALQRATDVPKGSDGPHSPGK